MAFLMKKRIKHIVYLFLFYSGLLSAFLMVFTKLKKRHAAVILIYHQIVDGDSRSYLHKGAAIHHQLKDFRAEMEFVRKWFRVISLDDVLSALRTETGFKKPSLAITFDDGYRDNYTLAYPVLRKLNVPATIYLTTGLIGTFKRTWVDDIEYALLRARVDEFTMPALFGNRALAIRTLKQKEAVNVRIGEALKRVSNARKSELMAELFARLEVDPTLDDNRTRRMLSWEEVREMSQNGISFAAHTSSHPILTQVPLDVARTEIFESKQKMEAELGKPVKHFAFPNGRHNDFSRELRDYCVSLGFETIATAEYGAVSRDSNPHYLLRLIPVIPLPHFAIELTRLFVFGRNYAKWREYDRG